MHVQYDTVRYTHTGDEIARDLSRVERVLSRGQGVQEYTYTKYFLQDTNIQGKREASGHGTHPRRGRARSLLS